MEVKVLTKTLHTETNPLRPSQVAFAYKDDEGKIVGYTYFEKAYQSGKAFLVDVDGHLSGEPRYADNEQALERLVMDSYADNLERKVKIRF